MIYKLKALISSTSLDLREHRQLARDACLRCGISPIMMEFLPFESDAIAVSVKMTQAADIYVGIFGRRYGYVPLNANPQSLSITEMEYEWAVRRNIPREIFVMDDSHPIEPEHLETGTERRVRALHQRVEAQNKVTYFSSAVELGQQILTQLRSHESRDEKHFGAQVHDDIHRACGPVVVAERPSIYR